MSWQKITSTFLVYIIYVNKSSHMIFFPSSSLYLIGLKQISRWSNCLHRREAPAVDRKKGVCAPKPKSRSLYQLGVWFVQYFGPSDYLLHLNRLHISVNKVRKMGGWSEAAMRARDCHWMLSLHNQQDTREKSTRIEYSPQCNLI